MLQSQDKYDEAMSRMWDAHRRANEGMAEIFEDFDREKAYLRQLMRKFCKEGV